MTQSETRLETSLELDDEAFLKELEAEQGLFEQMGATFAGPLRYWTAFAFLLSFAFFGLAVWAVYQAVTAIEVQQTVLWSTLAIWSFLAVSMIKVWFWLRMNHLAVLKEIKLLHMQVVRQR
ncbi:MAG: DUF6768 family protein [Pseudomonadota bacterium]